MKKAVSIVLAIVMIVIALSTSFNAEIINKEGIKSVQEALDLAQAASGEPIPTNRIYFKMPQLDNWYSDYGVYQGKYYAGIYWWYGAAMPSEYPGYRAMIEDYDQGIYYADVPDDVTCAIWNNGYAALQSERNTPKYEQQCSTVDLNLEGIWADEEDSLPEGGPNEDNMDGCIYIVDPEQLVTTFHTPQKPYYGNWYIYYGDGCYGSYAESSDNFTSVADNCLNPDHFDAQGNHIGGAHLTAPEAPEVLPTNPALNGYYIVKDTEPDIIRSENKLYASPTVGEYYKNVTIGSGYHFRIVYYEDGKALDEFVWYPEWGWFNANGELDDSPSGHQYTLYFYPDETGSASIKISDPWDYPTEAPTTAPTEAPTTAPTEEPSYTPEPVSKVYVVGNFTDWQIDEAYEMEQIYSTSPPLYVCNMDLTTDMQFKCVIVYDGEQYWYPDETGNSYGENGEITADGRYKISFRPQCDRKNWFGRCINAEYIGPTPTEAPTEALTEAPTEAPTTAPTEEPSYAPEPVSKVYVVGNFTDWQIDDAYEMEQIYSTSPPLYVCNIDLTTDMQFKCVIVYGDEQYWYPQGVGNNYGENGEITADGRYKISFRPQCDRKDWFGRCINAEYIGPTPTEPPTETPIEVPTEAIPIAPTEPAQSELYKEKLKAQYNLDDYDESTYTNGLMFYRELYYHHDDNGEIDWALVYCCCNWWSPMEVTAIIGNRVVASGDWLHPFQTGYGVYDVENDEFCDASSAAANQLNGFMKAMDEFSFPDKSVETFGLIGDLDNDDEISVIDATIIQRCQAMMRDYPENDEFRVTADLGRTARYYSDFDRNGERDITDATMIQRYLADMI